MELCNEITCLYLGVINFMYMFRVWGLSNFMLMFASGIAGSSEIKLRQQKRVFRSISSRGCVRMCVAVAYACASWLRTHVRHGCVRMCVAVSTEYRRDLRSH